MVFAIVVENFGVGLVSSALVAYIMSMCNRRFSATQFALLSSLVAASRDILVAPGGKIAESMGWPTFFLITVVAGLPCIALLPFIAPWNKDIPTRLSSPRGRLPPDQLFSVGGHFVATNYNRDVVGRAGLDRAMYECVAQCFEIRVVSRGRRDLAR